jgi:hypothetical protein
MAKVITPSTQAVALDASTLEVIANAVNAEASTYGARRELAKRINDKAPADTRWYALESQGQKLPPVIALIKDEYYKGLKGIGYSNPSNAWKMIKQYAQEDACDRSMFGEMPTTKGEGEGESEGEGEGNAKHARPLNLRLIEELTSLYKVCKREEKVLTDKQAKCFVHIASALTALGVELTLIK